MSDLLALKTVKPDGVQREFELKKLLHMGALSAIQHYEEFRAYNERKLKEGKHQLLVLNVIRSKIVLQIRGFSST